MKIKLAALTLEMNVELSKAEEIIGKKIGRELATVALFDNYFSEKEFIKAMSESIKDSNIIVVGAEPSIYLNFKNFIFNVFKFKNKEDKTLSKIIRENSPQTPLEEVLLHSLMPNGAKIMSSVDGFYSGFALRSNEQIFVLIPLDNERIENILDLYLIPYLKTNAKEEILNQIVQSKVEKDKEPKMEQNKQNLTAFPYNRNLAQRVVDVLKKRNQKIGFASTNTVDFLKKIIDDNSGFNESIVLSSFFVKNMGESEDFYCRTLSQGARSAAQSEYGISLTNVYSLKKNSGELQRYIFLCVFDGKLYRSEKIVASETQTIPELIYHAIDRIFEIILEELSNITDEVKDINKKEEIRTESDNDLSKLIANIDDEKVEKKGKNPPLFNEKPKNKEKGRIKKKDLIAALISASMLLGAIISSIGIAYYYS